MAITLRGMTWSHPRGYDPMVACSALWRQATGVDVAWEKRSLQDFESFPVEELARAYDLIVIDHPHVGQITAEGCLLPLDVPGREAALAAIAGGSVGASYASYRWQGRQWAFPIDAAAQVQAWRPDLLTSPATTWNEVLALASAGRVLVPLRPPHSLMCFYTLAANLGGPCASSGPGDLVAPADGERAYALLQALVQASDLAVALDMDPIAVSERMAEPDSPIACAPLIYGYVPYARAGFRARRLAFADIPADRRGPVGSALGGTGIAVSARTAHPEAALEFAYWIAGADVQRGAYARSGGQPGHAAAWEDDTVNADSGAFYRATRESLERAYVRPRHAGYMAFQHAAADRINAGLRAAEDGARVVADLNRLFRLSGR